MKTFIFFFFVFSIHTYSQFVIQKSAFNPQVQAGIYEDEGELQFTVYPLYIDYIPYKDSHDVYVIIYRDYETVDSFRIMPDERGFFGWDSYRVSCDEAGHYEFWVWDCQTGYYLGRFTYDKKT